MPASARSIPARSIPVGEVRQLGDDALLVGVEDPAAACMLTRALDASGMGGLTEVVGGFATVMVAVDPEAGDLGAVRQLLQSLMDPSGGEASPGGSGQSGGFGGPGDAAGDEGSVLVIPCAFDGPDLDEVAEIAGCAPDAVVELVIAGPLTAAVVGFAPGFAYLDGLPDELRHVPRRARPRPAVPPGSVALANGHAAVYPTSSPGGWQLIGRTDVVLFTPEAAPYARLAPGDRVQFTRATAPLSGGPPQSAQGAAAPRPAAARLVFEVEDAGLRTVLQDGGRRGLAALGVPAASPGDPLSFRLANQLVGNPADACTLEATARGPTLRCRSATFVAAVGASPALLLDGQPIAAGRVVPVGPGQQLAVGAVRGGFRSYVAVAGGFVGPTVLGSQSCDQLSALGPGPLRAGALLWAAAMEPPLGDHLRDDTLSGVSEGEPVVLRVVPGPHPERFAADALASLASARFRVDAESNRVGLRLAREAYGPPLRDPDAPVELDSQGVVTGAVQVPPDGEPVVLLTDHATLGGYPVVAVVAAVDHGKLGQCAPGAVVVFDPIDHDQARAASRAQQRILQSAVVGRYPLAVE